MTFLKFQQLFLIQEQEAIHQLFFGQSGVKAGQHFESFDLDIFLKLHQSPFSQFLQDNNQI